MPWLRASKTLNVVAMLRWAVLAIALLAPARRRSASDSTASTSSSCRSIPTARRRRGSRWRRRGAPARRRSRSCRSSGSAVRACRHRARQRHARRRAAARRSAMPVRSASRSWSSRMSGWREAGPAPSSRVTRTAGGSGSSATARRSLPIARIAAEEGAEALSIGTELKRPRSARNGGTSSPRCAPSFPGSLTYAAHNVEEAEAVPFWPQLDAIGVTLYPPLGEDARSRQAGAR